MIVSVPGLCAPGRRRVLGRLHPLSQVTEDIVRSFRKLGFVVADGPPMLKSENARLNGWTFVDIRGVDVGSYVAAAQAKVRDEVMEVIAERTDHIRRVNLIDAEMAARLSSVDERSHRAGLIGSDPKGLFKIKA